MSDHLKRSRAGGALAQPPIATGDHGRAVPSIASAMLAWLDRVRQRRVAYGLSDHMLKDVGLSRRDFGHESSRQFWRE